MPTADESPSAVQDSASEAETTIQRFFGDFELGDELGRGAMGVIYHARQVSLNRSVALKMILSSHMGTPGAIQRFQTEAEAAARLDHPNIVPIYEIGEHHHQHFYVMRLIRGGDLAGRMHELVLRRSQSEHLDNYLARDRQEAIATFLGKVAHAVHHAHQHGILHRDLKPTNILVDECQEPYVADFGLAKLSDDQSGMTLTLAVLGTPSYMAPEQASGHAKQATITSDVYSLGAIFYEMLTSQPPFQGETPMETMRQVLENEPRRPRSLEPTVDRDLETICLRCLEKAPEKRYVSALALAEDLDRWRKGQVIEARPVTSFEALLRWCRRKPLVAGLAGALAVVLGSGLVGVLGQWQRAERLAKAERAQHQRSLQMLAELQIERAQQSLRDNDSAEALTMLARVLRQNPANQLAASRLLHALTQRSFPLPHFEPWSHKSPLTWAEFSPDGRFAITASADGIGRIWDTVSGKPISRLEGHQAQILTAKLSPNGQWAATASSDGTARVWDVETGNALATLDHKSSVTFVDFSPTQPRVVTASQDENAKVWDIHSGTDLFGRLPHKNFVQSARFSPDGNWIVTASLDNTAQIWDARTGLRHGGPLRHGKTVWYAEFSHDSERVVTASADGTARVWDRASGVEIGAELRHEDEVLWAEFSPDGLRIVTASLDRTARIWDASTGRAETVPLVHRQRVLRAHFSPDGLRVITTSNDNIARLWDARSGALSGEPVRHYGIVSHARFSPDGQAVLTASEDATACLWDVRLGQSLPLVVRHPTGIVWAEGSPDCLLVATVCSNFTARVWNLESGDMVAGPFRHRSRVHSAFFHPNGKELLTASDDRTARIWKLESDGSAPFTLSHTGSVFFACFSPSGNQIATAGSDNQARVWRHDGSTTNTAVFPHRDRISHLQFSPDGQVLGVAAADQTATLWHIKSGKPMRIFHHTAKVNSIRFSRDGRWAVTASGDRTAQVWDLATGKQATSPLVHDAEVVFADFSVDARTVVTTSTDRTARVWDAASGRLRQGPFRHEGKVNLALLTPGELSLLTASDDGTARLWDLQSGQGLSEPFSHEGGIVSAGFGSLGRKILTGSLDSTLRVWQTIQVPVPVPSWVPKLAEALACRRINDEGTSEPVEADGLVRLGRSLGRQSGQQDFYQAWGSWFFADRGSRKASPNGRLSTQDYLQRESGSGDAAALRHCLAVAPTNVVAVARLSRVLLGGSKTTSSKDLVEASFHWHRAFRLAPSDSEVIWSRALILNQEGQTRAGAELMSTAAPQQRDPRFWNCLGLLSQQAGLLLEAEVAFSRALELLQNREEQAQKIFWMDVMLNRAELRQALGRSQEARLDWLTAHGISQRDPSTPKHLLDLTDFYHAGLKDDWHNPKDLGNNLSNLPWGRQNFAGIEFDVRGIVQLASPRTQPYRVVFPDRVEGIPVGLRCQSIHFLHGTGWVIPAAEPRKQIGSFTFHYADGQQRLMPIYYGDHVRDWHVSSDKSKQSAEATVAWEGETPAPEPAGVRLYKCTWVNPLPDLVVESLDYSSSGTDCALFLIAATAE